MSESINVTIKSSGDAKYEVSILPSSTVLELKKEIETKSEIPFDRQRLIYSGKVLKDAETVESYKVQSGHTIHLVKSAGAPKPAEPSAASTSSDVATTNTSTSNAASAGAGIPTNIASGQGSFNPLADLTGARYAGYTQLPSASMFGPDGGMNQNMPDPDQMAEMMSNPMVQEQMNQMFSNPQMLDFMINQSPELRAMGPQAREMLQSPFFRQMLSNPEMMRSMMQMGRGGGFGGAGGAGAAFPAPGSATGDSDADSTSNTNTSGGANNNNNNNNNNTAAAANPFASMFPGGMPPIDPYAMFGGGANQAAAAPADTRPPEERYESQLRQLNDMGFFDFDRNIEALRRTGGSVQGAIEYLLSN